MRNTRILQLILAVPCTFSLLAEPGIAQTDSELTELVETQNIGAISALGASILPSLVSRYERSDTATRTKIAAILYGLGWKSEEAKRVLMQDIKTQDTSLRLQVQWALGRVSNDDDVVARLLENMRDDPNPLFRDKAACALADDQIHLTEKQKVKLYEGVIAALSDPKEDVRRIAGQVMKIQTGQSKGFNARGSQAEREVSIAAWRKWLEEYRKAVADDK